MKATAIAVRFSKSLARRRHRLSHAKVRSTTHRRGKTSNPLAVSNRFTIVTESPGSAFARRTEFRPLVSTVGEQLLKERIKPEHGRHDIHPTVTVLDVRRMNDRVQQQSYRIDEDMPLLSLDLLAGIVTIRINASPRPNAREDQKPRSSLRLGTITRGRVVRMVREHGGDHASQWAAISSIAPKIGCTPETLRKWVRQSKRDQGTREPPYKFWPAGQ